MNKKEVFRDANYERKERADLVKNRFARICPKCGFKVIVFNRFHKDLCRICNTMVYLDKKDEYKEKMKRLLK